MAGTVPSVACVCTDQKQLVIINLMGKVAGIAGNTILSRLQVESFVGCLDGLAINGDPSGFA